MQVGLFEFADVFSKKVTVDLDFDDRAARDGRQQHATQRVAERVAEAALEGLDDDARPVRTDALDLDATRTQHSG